MDCVGLRPGFSLVEKAVALYWDRGEKELAVEFVRDVLRRRGLGAGAGGEHSSANGDGERGGPVGYLAWKMMDTHSKYDGGSWIFCLDRE